MLGKKGAREDAHQSCIRIEWGMCAGEGGGAREDFHPVWIRVELHRTNYSLRIGGGRLWEVELGRWSSNHLRTYDFLTCMMLWDLKPFKHLWLRGFSMFLKLFVAMPSLLWTHDSSKRVSETWKNHKVIGVWMVWAPKASLKSKSHRFLNGLSFRGIRKVKKS